MKIVPYKGREVDLSRSVEMYRCLNRKGYTFSVRQGGKVVGHTNDIVLGDCDLVVNQSGKSRCQTSKQRNVHAFVRGFIKDEPLLSHSFLLKYYPFDNKGFCYQLLDKAISISKAKTVYINKNNIYCQI